MQEAFLHRASACKTTPAMPMGGCTFLSLTVRAGKKLVLMCLQVQTQTAWRALAFLCIIPSSGGLADQVYWYLLPTLESFVCFPDTAGWNLFKHFICWHTGEEGSSLALSLTSVAWYSFYRMKKRNEKIALNASVEELEGQI